MSSDPNQGADPAHPHPHPQDAPTPDDACQRYEALREQLPEAWRDEAWPAPMIDGYLCGVLLQPRPVPAARWWSVVEALTRDAVAEAVPQPAGRPAPSPLTPLKSIAEQRFAQLDAAIGARQWFDPWVWQTPPSERTSEAFQAGDPDLHGGEEHDDGTGEDMPATVREPLYPWVAGFMEAMVQFDDLLELGDAAAAEPQALICQFLDRDDLEDADALWDLIDTLEPPAELADGVECLVRATLLLADITRPVRRDNTRAPNRSDRGRPTPGRGRGNLNRGGSRRF